MTESSMNRYYEMGSAARNMYIDNSAAPAIEEPLRRKTKTPSKQEIRKNRIVKRNQDKALALTPGYIVFLSFMIALTCVAAVIYIKLQTDTNIYTDEIAVLQNEIETLKVDNDEFEKRISSSVDMDNIRLSAKSLGMVYPKQSQIMYYSLDTSDYMTQYSSVN